MQPLSLGMEGPHELAHLTLGENIDATLIKGLLQKTCPAGLTIKKVIPCKVRATWFHKRKDTVKYEITFKENLPDKTTNSETKGLLRLTKLTPNSIQILGENTSQYQLNIKDFLFSYYEGMSIINMKRIGIFYKPITQ